MKPLRVFYEECILSKIRQCELRSNSVRGSSGCIRRRAEINRAMATYLEDNKAELIDVMLNNGVGTDLRKINIALSKAFWSLFPVNAFSGVEYTQPFEH